MNGRHSTCVWIAAATAALRLPAQQPGERTVAVVVTAVADRSVWFDHGLDQGLGVGSFVRLFPPGAGEIEVEVRAVSQTSARADLPPGLPLPPIGTRGEARTASPPPAPTTPRATEPKRTHAPWQRQDAPRTDDQPLLVPAYGQRPDQRPATLDGRAFLSGQWNHDASGELASDWWLLRTGLRADAENHLGTGERIRLAGEYDDRRTQVDDRPDEHDQTLRLDLASVAFGTEAWAPNGAEFGRFLSPHLPELGLLDGGEVVHRLQGGVRFGAGGGAYPRPFPARDAGEDLGVHAFVDWTADAARSAAVALGLQKTWHRGAPDRDLVLLRGEWRPGGGLWFLGHGKLDWYSGSDHVKGRGLELTELLLQARWDDRTLGTGLSAQRFTWPELKRAEYQQLPPALVRDGFVDRLGWQGSWRALDALSLRVRADLWRDQDRNGSTFGADADWRRPWSDGSAISLVAFVNDGGQARGPGARLTVRERWGDTSWRASWRWYHYELPDLATGAESWTRQSAELGVSLPLGRCGDLELAGERWFGDREDAWAVNLYLQWRF
jgi:hypothetical protein